MLSRGQLRKVILSTLRARREPRLQGKPRGVVAAYALVQCMSPWERATRHFILVARHKWHVFLYCAYSGHPWRGLMHDWSKFSPTEFLGSIRYFNGRRSPVGLCRDVEGYSFAWLHHKGRNKHHYEFWTDSVDPCGNHATKSGQIFPIPMPYEYALESICDTIAASRAYNGKKFSYEVLYKWWLRSQKYFPPTMHPQTKRFAGMMYEAMRADGNCSALRRAREIFERAQQDEK